MTSGSAPPPDVLHFVVRDASADDAMAIDALTQAAFRDPPFSRVVPGDPAYCGRFGFAPIGEVRHHPAFSC